MSEELVNLEAHNEQVEAQALEQELPKKNGFACPVCGKELVDSKPGEVLTHLNVEMKPGLMATRVHCDENNDYVGLRYL